MMTRLINESWNLYLKMAKLAKPEFVISVEGDVIVIAKTVGGKTTVTRFTLDTPWEEENEQMKKRFKVRGRGKGRCDR